MCCNSINNFVNIEVLWDQTGKSIVEWQHNWKNICQIMKAKYGVSSIESCRTLHTDIFGISNRLSINDENIDYWCSKEWLFAISDKQEIGFYIYPYTEAPKIYNAWKNYYNIVNNRCSLEINA